MSTDSPSTTDRLAWIKRRLHLATPRDVGPREADFDAECRRLQTARLDLSVWAPLDIEYLLERLDTAEERLATARKYQLAAVVSWYVAWQRDADRVSRRPSIADTIANHSEGRFRGALAAFQDLLIALGEIEGDEECEAAWQVVETEMAAAKSLGAGEEPSDV